MTTKEANIRVRSLKVTGLFGLYDHHVTLNKDRVTVIHGPNGVGKTVFLKLTNNFLRGRYVDVLRVPFHSFEITFDNGCVARVEKHSLPAGSKAMRLIFESLGNEPESIEFDAEIAAHFAQRIASDSGYLRQIGLDESIVRRINVALTRDELVERASEFTSEEPKRLAELMAERMEPMGLREIRSKVKVHLIEVQRLLQPSQSSDDSRFRAGRDRTTTETVQEYAHDLKRRLESTFADYAKRSQKLDQTFPQRLLQGTHLPLPRERLEVELQEIERTRERLKSIGVIESDQGPVDDPLRVLQRTTIESSQLPVLSVYARDTKEKLSVLEPLSERIAILLDVLNQKFIHKRVTISKDKGLAVYGTDGVSIPVTALSSGEQHELVLLYDLLFKVEPNTLVLIDEPELSLHISWQKGFMDDLLKIIQVAKFDVLMATHSPYIVGDHSDLLVVLSPNIPEPLETK